jgi:uncharacterized protein (TIGR00297 family)
LNGSVATFLLATLIYGIGGWKWTSPILLFFISSSILSYIGKTQKMKYDLIFEKGHKRDVGQVAANGGTACLILLGWYVYPQSHQLFILYLASVAAVTADTWGTEIGTLWRGQPWSIISFKKVEPGTSGAISILGTAGGVAGAALITIFMRIFFPGVLTDHESIIIILSGAGGALIDSILGATVQASYKDNSTGKLTEKQFIGGSQTNLVRGFRFIDNDIVNWFCAISGALWCYLLLNVLR